MGKDDFEDVAKNNIGISVIRSTKKVRLTVRVDEPLAERLESLVDLTGVRNVQGVMKQALVLYDALMAEAELGKDIIVVDSFGQKTKYPLFVHK